MLMWQNPIGIKPIRLSWSIFELQSSRLLLGVWMLTWQNSAVGRSVTFMISFSDLPRHLSFGSDLDFHFRLLGSLSVAWISGRLDPIRVLDPIRAPGSLRLG